MTDIKNSHSTDAAESPELDTSELLQSIQDRALNVETEIHQAKRKRAATQAYVAGILDDVRLLLNSWRGANIIQHAYKKDSTIIPFDPTETLESINKNERAYFADMESGEKFRAYYLRRYIVWMVLDIVKIHSQIERRKKIARIRIKNDARKRLEWLSHHLNLPRSSTHKEPKNLKPRKIHRNRNYKESDYGTVAFRETRIANDVYYCDRCGVTFIEPWDHYERVVMRMGPNLTVRRYHEMCPHDPEEEHRDHDERDEPLSLSEAA